MSSEAILTRRFSDHIERTGALLPAQREAVFSDAPLTLVGAGAGTGKTHTLAWRFVRCLLREGVRPRDILTLTFTEKAASEMAERIGALFAELRPVLDPDGSLLAATAAELQEATISTIHSFALAIVREEALFLPSGLSARAMTPPEADLFVRRCTDALDEMDMDWFRRALSSGRGLEALLGGGEQDLADVLNAYGAKGVAAFALALSDMLESRGGSPETLAESAEREDFIESVRERLESLLRAPAVSAADLWLGRVLPGLPSELPGGGAFKERTARLRSRWGGRRAGTPEEAMAFCADLHGELLGNLTGSTSGSGKALAELLGEPLKDYRDRRAALWDGLRFLSRGFLPEDLRLRSVLLRTAAMVWETFREFRRRRGLLSFDDMIRVAASAVRGSGERARTYRDVLVDEFQDTSPLQESLIRSVAGEEGRVFLVGDVKQSIYRFRHADPTLFGGLIEGSGEGVRYIPLQSNFRSRPALLGHTNDLFGRLWSDGVSSSLRQPYEELLFPDDGALRARREETALPAVTCLFMTPSEEDGRKETVGAVRRRVARALAGHLLNSLGQPVWDKGQGAFRPARWGDMAILVPSRTSFAALEDVLYPEFGIPTAFERGKQYFARGETRDLLSAVAAIANPGDRAALLAYMSSPFSGLSVDQAMTLLGREGADSDQAFPEAATRLDELRATAVCGGLYQALLLLLRDQSFLRHMPAWGRRGAFANLRKGLDMVRTYEAAFGPDAAGCAASLSAMAGRPGSVEETASLSDDEDVVRVLTVHSSKGLEFPVVAVMDLNNRPGGGGGTEVLLPSPLLGVGASSYPGAWSGEKNETRRLARFLEDGENGEEWQRLFYVACTRARDSLILCSPCGVEDDVPRPTPGSWLDLLGPNPSILEEERSAPTGRGTEDGPSGRTVRRVRPPRPDLALERLSATSYALFRWCPAAWRMKYRQGFPLVWELPAEDAPGGADLGSLAHWVLARWDFLPQSAERLLAPESPPAYLPGDLRPVWRSERSRDALGQWLHTFAASPLGLRLADLAVRKALRRETPFRLSEGGLLLTGSMDLLWEEEGTVFIRDYKITAADLRGQRPWEPLYDAQLAFYGYAASRLFPGRGQDIRLVHLREGREGAPFTPEGTWEDEGRIIAETAHRAAQGPFDPVTARCSDCFYRLDCPFVSEKGLSS